MSDTLAEIFHHNLWANLKLLDACSGLSEAQLAASEHGTYGSIGATLVHIVSAEEHYVGLLKGARLEDRVRVKDPFPGFEKLREHARRSGEALISIAKGFTETYRIVSKLHPSDPDNLRAVVPLLQAMNHATEHRAHVMTILTQQGVEPPQLDAWAWNRERF
ncbi:MAG: damage-inducible protein DinB [SAR202 cluster bacterium]|nr:damage-inducible protein DinB [SAR202 cluster bacterium]